MNGPQLKPLAFELSELQAILEQARSTPLSEEQHHTLQAVVETLARLTQELEKKRISIGRLRNLLFGPRTEKTEDVVKGKRRAKAGAPGAAGRGKKNRRKGHGRNGADAYTGAKHLAVPHESLKPGDPCPQSGCTGKVYKLCEPGTIVRIKGLQSL